MIRRRNVPVSLVMPPQEQHRLANVFILLITIDRRVNAQQAQTKKAKKVNTRKGSLTCGPHTSPRLRRAGLIFFQRFIYRSIVPITIKEHAGWA